MGKKQKKKQTKLYVDCNWKIRLIVLANYWKEQAAQQTDILESVGRLGDNMQLSVVIKNCCKDRNT